MGELCSRPRVIEDADPYEIGNNLCVVPSACRKSSVLLGFLLYLW